MVLLMIDVINKAGALYASEIEGVIDRNTQRLYQHSCLTTVIYLLTALELPALIR